MARGDKWAVVGRNGSGKTTLFRIITGETEPSAGTVARAGGLRYSVMEQHREFVGATTVWEAAAGRSATSWGWSARWRSRPPRSPRRATGALRRCSPVTTATSSASTGRAATRSPPRIDAVLQGLGFDPDAARSRALAELSGGERGRLGLVQQLVAPADLLLLDEPTNHLDLETTTWLEQYLRGLSATVLVISHDRAFLQAVVDHVLHLDGGTGVAYTGDYEAFVRQRAERRLSRQRAFTKQARSIAAEEDYIRRNIAGGNSAQAKGRRRRLARVSRLSPPPGEEGAMALQLTAEERSGDQVLVAEDVRLSVDGRTLLREFDARLMRGDVVGLVGPNGAGKSTLLRAITGERPVDGGAIRVRSPPGSRTTGRIWPKSRLTRPSTTSSRRSGPTGDADRFRATSADSASPGIRCSGGPARCPAASGRGSRSR